MLPNLLEEVPLPLGGKKVPLMLDNLEVNSELVPFLVSATRQTQWVFKTSKAGTVRAATRKREGAESHILTAVADLAEQAEWGNLHALTSEGILACVTYLSEYIEDNLEIVVAPETSLEGINIPNQVTVARAGWVPRDTAVVVPLDRSYLGTMWIFDKDNVAFLLHNVSRGIALAWK